MSSHVAEGNRNLIKHIRFMRRRPGITHEEFREAWLRHHAPMMAARTQALRYYCVAFQPIGGADQAFHYAVTLWYRDMEHWRRAYSSPPPTTDDPTATMSDRQSSVLLVTKEHVNIEGPTPLATCTWYLWRPAKSLAEGSSPEWDIDLAPLMALDSSPVRLVTAVALDPRPDALYVALTELGWATDAARQVGSVSAAVQSLFLNATRLIPAEPVIVIP
jgi:hypothetical protein